jgi:hypothetical protein
MRKRFCWLLLTVAGAIPMPAMAQAAYPRLAAYDHCIGQHVRQHFAGDRRPVSETEKDRIAQAALNQCQAMLPGAVLDYKALVMNMARGTQHEARAASSTDSEWRDKVVSMRFDLAKILVSVATAPPPPPDQSGSAY